MRFFRKFIKFNIIFILLFIIWIYTYAFLSPKLDIKNANQFYIYDINDNIISQGSGNS